MGLSVGAFSCVRATHMRHPQSFVSLRFEAATHLPGYFHRQGTCGYDLRLQAEVGQARYSRYDSARGERQGLALATHGLARLSGIERATRASPLPKRPGRNDTTAIWLHNHPDATLFRTHFVRLSPAKTAKGARTCNTLEDKGG